MENVKYKRREVGSKNYVRKVGKQPPKRVKKSKGKESLEPLLRTRHKCCKLGAKEPLRGLPIKDVRGVDGMFGKRSRTQYTTTGTLPQVNEARKNEDFSKIIDIGRVYFLNGKLAVPPGRPGKGVRGFGDSRKSDKLCSDSGESSTDSSQDFECSLSPISPPPTRGREHGGTAIEFTRAKNSTADEMPVTRRKLDLERELDTFSLKYEAVVGAQILFKLPENGVLEDALTALRKLQKTRQKEEPEREEPLSCSQVEFLRNDLEAEDYILWRNCLAPEERFCENFMEDIFIMSGAKVENVNHSSHLTAFDDGDEGRSANIEFQAKDFQNPVEELRIASPPIQFYRRNMF